MNKLRKLSLISYGIIAFLSLISLSVYLANVNTAYYEDMNSTVVILMVGVLVIWGAALFTAAKGTGRFLTAISDLCRIAIPVLLIISGVTFTGMRLESFGYIFGSNLELGNDAAFSAATQAVGGIALFFLTWLLSVVACFFKMNKN